MTLVRHSIDVATAERAMAAAAQHAAAAGLRMSIAVVDDSGDLKAFRRMDGAPKLSIQISQDKAYTATSFGIPTHSCPASRTTRRCCTASPTRRAW